MKDVVHMEARCEKCGWHWIAELRTNIKDWVKINCPKCGATEEHILVSWGPREGPGSGRWVSGNGSPTVSTGWL
jgi:phage FluMu protein Com